MIDHLEQIVRRFRTSAASLPDWVDSVALGGSYSRSLSDEHSDLDLFVTVLCGDHLTYERVAEELHRWIGLPALRRGPVFLEHFGQMVTLVLDDLSICQLILNTPDSLELNQMRASSQMICDRSGHVTTLVALAKQLREDIAVAYVDNYRLFWVRALYAQRSLVRGQLWRAVYYMNDMRGAMLKLIRIRDGKYDPSASPHTPAARFENDLGARPSNEIAFCLPQYSAESIEMCVRMSAQWFEAESSRSEYNRALSREDRETGAKVARLTVHGLAPGGTAV